MATMEKGCLQFNFKSFQVMRNRNLITMILIILGLFSALTYAYSAFVGKSNVAPGITKQPCDQMFPGTMNLQFSSVNLKYDLTDQPSHENLLLEFATFHPDMVSSKGSITHLSNILVNRDLVANVSSRPKVELSLSSSECTGSLSKNFEPSEIGDYIVYNIPAFGTLLEKIELDVRSVKSSINNTQLCWNAIILVSDINNIVIDDDAEISCECSWCAVSKSYLNGYYVAARVCSVDDELIYEEIENSNSATISNDSELIFKINYENKWVPPYLDKPIFRYPDEVPSLSWDAPVLINKRDLI